MTIATITTVDHNIGDDFVREGLLFILASGGLTDNIELIHKHSPVTSFYGLEFIRDLNLSNAIFKTALDANKKNRVDDASILVQSGAPIYWCHENNHCSDNEWFTPLIRNLYKRRKTSKIFLNLAGGSCQAYHSDGSEFAKCPKCLNYIREFFDVCDLTILRDLLAKKILNIAGRDALVLPCTSIFARDQFKIEPKAGRYIILNFMENGGHYTFGQDIDTQLWRQNFKKLVEIVKKMGKVVISCHSENEFLLAKKLHPDIEAFLVPNDHVAFLEFYSNASWGIVNRVHAAFAMASFGKPAYIIGNDTRALMIENLQLKSFFVEDISKIDLEEMVGEVRLTCKGYPDVISSIRSSALTTYINQIKKLL